MPKSTVLQDLAKQYVNDSDYPCFSINGRHYYGPQRSSSEHSLRARSPHKQTKAVEALRKSSAASYQRPALQQTPGGPVIVNGTSLPKKPKDGGCGSGKGPVIVDGSNLPAELQEERHGLTASPAASNNLASPEELADESAWRKPVMRRGKYPSASESSWRAIMFEKPSRKGRRASVSSGHARPLDVTSVAAQTDTANVPQEGSEKQPSIPPVEKQSAMSSGGLDHSDTDHPQNSVAGGIGGSSNSLRGADTQREDGA